MLPQLRLFEFEDFQWFPKTIRDLMTDVLHFIFNRLPVYDSIFPKIAKILHTIKHNQIIDLCSGGGGPILRLSKYFAARSAAGLSAEGLSAEGSTKITITDLFPNKAAFEHIAENSNGVVNYVLDPVDATDVPKHLIGLRTFFTAFHHFTPEQAQQILTDAVRHKQAIAIFEATARDIPTFCRVLLVPIAIMLATPFIRPLYLSRLFFTYALPVVPVWCLWDGVASNFRSYSQDQFKAMIKNLHADYTWDIGTTYSILGWQINYLIGCPNH